MPHSQNNNPIFQSQEELFLKSLCNKRNSHAYLLYGEMGIGKFELAVRLARHFLVYNIIFGAKNDNMLSLFADENIRDKNALTQQQILSYDDSNILMQLNALSHPDVRVLGSESSSDLSIDKIREVTSFLQLSSANSGAKIVIINNAENMNANAANALLKSLEEPPGQSIIFIISNNIGQILPTIKSRCQKIYLSRPSQEQFEQIISDLTDKFPNAIASLADIEEIDIWWLSRGVPGKAELWLNALDDKKSKFDELLNRLVNFISSLPAYKYQDIVMLSEGFVKISEKITFNLIAELLLTMISDLAKEIYINNHGTQHNDYQTIAAIRKYAHYLAADSSSNNYIFNHITAKYSYWNDYFNRVIKLNLSKKHAIMLFLEDFCQFFASFLIAK